MKHIDVNEFFNITSIISELESSLNDDDAIDSSVVTEGETEASVVAEVVQEADITMGEVGD